METLTIADVCGIITVVSSLYVALVTFLSRRKSVTPCLRSIEYKERGDEGLVRLVVASDREYCEIEDISVDGCFISELWDKPCETELLRIPRFGEWRRSLPFIIQLDPREKNRIICFSIDLKTAPKQDVFNLRLSINKSRFICWPIDRHQPTLL